jgi:hypothetical protein
MADYNRYDLLIKTATYSYPEEIPVSIGMLPAVFIKHGDAVRKLMEKYPGLEFGQDINYDPVSNMAPSYHEGQYTDPWGCLWSNIEEGMESLVTGHPLPTRESVHTMKVPQTYTGFSHGFMYLRLLDLRGFEEMMIDFAEEPPELQMLIDNVLNYNLAYIRQHIEENTGRILWFGDDLGMQSGLAIGAEKWRKYMKPCFSAIYKPCVDAGKLIYMHTDGCIWEIMSDLIECGVSIINPQFRANGLYKLVSVCKGKIPINLDLDRQLFPFASPAELRDHVMECVKALYLPEGGLGLNLEISPDIPLCNIDALFDVVNTARKYKG